MFTKPKFVSFKTVLKPILITLVFSLNMSIAKADESLATSDIEELKEIKQHEAEVIHHEAVDFAAQYRKTAELVAKQGGDPKPLLEAAAYYENKAK